MACKYTYKGITYNSKEEFISQIINPQFLSNQKIRRVMELQSDLFQKGRDEKYLTDKFQGEKYSTGELRKDSFTTGNKSYRELGNKVGYFLKGDVNYYEISNQEYEIAYNKALEEHENRLPNPKNQFLQLLNKDNNWVTFFIRAIIQSTAKERIYEASLPDIEEKVLSLQKEGKLKIDCK